MSEYEFHEPGFDAYISDAIPGRFTPMPEPYRVVTRGVPARAERVVDSEWEFIENAEKRVRHLNRALRKKYGFRRGLALPYHWWVHQPVSGWWKLDAERVAQARALAELRRPFARILNWLASLHR